MTEAEDTLPGAERRTWSLPDGDLAGWVWPNPGAPVLLFAHANGFCASAYRQVLEPLAERFEIVAPDLRGHGRTTLPADPQHHRSWDVYARDLLALIEQLPAPPSVMAGHSMGAVASLLAAARMVAVPRLALVEPVVMPAGLYVVARSPLRGVMKNRFPIARQARRRRNGWSDHDAALARYAAHPNFARWRAGVLADWLLDGLKETPEGVALACDPQWEAANYEAQGHDIGRAARRAGPHMHLLKAQYGSTLVRPEALTRRGAQMTRLDGVGHLAPMEAPERVTAWLGEAVRDL